MTGFVKVSLNRLINNIGESETNKILSDFSCPLNLDIEDFLIKKSTTFEKQGISKTHLGFSKNPFT